MIDYKWYVVRVISGREVKIKDYIESEIEKHELKKYVNQIVVPLEKVVQLRRGKKITKEKNFYPGYILLEADSRETAELAAFDLMNVKGLLPKTVQFEEIKNMIEPEVTQVNIEKGDIVEIIAEPFKKEKAKVVRIDKTKEEAVVELLEAAVPIPITVKIDNIRVIRREKEE